MLIPIVIPQLKSGDEPLSISGWLVDLSDRVVAGDLIVELLIPGITFDMAAESSGRVTEILKPVDAIVHPGETIGWIDDETGSSPGDHD